MTSSRARRCRGTILVATTILLMVLALAAGTAITATGDDARLSTLRVDSIRSFYAAESGVEIAIRTLIDDPANPAAGTISLPDGSVIEFITPFAAAPAPPGTATIEGRYGAARRRLDVEAQ